LLADKPTISHLSWRSISVEVETVLAVVFIVKIGRVMQAPPNVGITYSITRIWTSDLTHSEITYQSVGSTFKLVYF